MRESISGRTGRKHGALAGSRRGSALLNSLAMGIVVDVDDPNKLNRVKVDVSSFYGTIIEGTSGGEKYRGAIWCRQMANNGGTTEPVETQAGKFGQSTFGVICQPPAVGNEVLVAFTEDLRVGVILGVLPDISRMGDSAGAGEYRKTNSGKYETAFSPSKDEDRPDASPPAHPQQEFIKRQGLAEDGLRGQNTSNPRRFGHSRVAGMTTPDGHAITMDDGDPDGNGRNMRIRTRAGNQIFMDDENGFIYIVNRDGTTWIELNSRGDIDVYGKNSINMSTQGDFNVHAEGKFNVHANGGINMSASNEGVKIASTKGKMELYGEDGMNQESGSSFNVKAQGGYIETAARIDMNGPSAQPATKPTLNSLGGSNRIVDRSVASRVPEAEPWGGHMARKDVRISPPAGTFAAEGGTGGTGFSTAGDSRPRDGFRDVNIGDYDEENIPVAASSDEYIDWATGVDRRVDPELLNIVREVAKKFGRKLTITSGYRDPGKNRKAGGAQRSQHMLGKAVDISGRGMSNADKLELIEIASKEGIRGIGVYDSSGAIHLDIRSGSRAGWGGDFTASSIPGWAENAVDRHRSGGYA